MKSPGTDEVSTPLPVSVGAKVAQSRGPPTPGRSAAFVLPYLPFLIMFGIFPMIYAAILAFTDDSSHWAGLSNFTGAFTDYRFRPGFNHLFLYTGIVLGLLLVLVVGLA